MSLFEFKNGGKEEPAYIGSVLQVSTRRVVIDTSDDCLGRSGVGKLVAIKKGSAEDWMIGMVDKVARRGGQGFIYEGEDLNTSGNTVTVTLIGMTRQNKIAPRYEFTRSLIDMPDIDQACFVLDDDNLDAFIKLLVCESDNEHALEIGRYAMDPQATAYFDGDRFFQRHAAILGSTGSGKSWTVATILERAAKLPSGNLVVLDIHGEYRKLEYADQLRIPGPDDLRSAANPSLLYLPYWLMNAEELIATFIDNSEFSAHNQTLMFQETVVSEKKRTLEAFGHDDILTSFTMDSPVPFDIEVVRECLKDINNEMVPGARGPKKGDFNGQFSRLLARIGAKLNDRRYGFLFQAPTSMHDYEALHTIANQLLAFDGTHSGVKVIDFSEVPADVLPVILGIVARLIYNLQFWMPDERRHPVAIVCDEAHIYLPRERGNPNQRRALDAFEKIAKEGRKYGVSLTIVSQRPSDVSTTILSQCNNVVALRLSNNNDLAAVKSMMPESMVSFMEMLPVLDIGEALVVGDAVLLPSRIHINTPTEKPLSATVDFWQEWSQPSASPDWTLSAENMRRQRRSTSS